MKISNKGLILPPSLNFYIHWRSSIRVWWCWWWLCWWTWCWWWWWWCVSRRHCGSGQNPGICRIYIWNRCSIIPNYTPIYFVYTFYTFILYAQGLRPCHGRSKIDSIITSEVSRMEVFQNMFFYVFDMIQIWFVVLICFWPGFAVMILIRFPIWFWYGFSHNSWCGSKLWFWGIVPCKFASWGIFQGWPGLRFHVPLSMYTHAWKMHLHIISIFISLVIDPCFQFSLLTTHWCCSFIYLYNHSRSTPIPSNHIIWCDEIGWTISNLSFFLKKI